MFIPSLTWTLLFNYSFIQQLYTRRLLCIRHRANAEDTPISNSEPFFLMNLIPVGNGGQEHIYCTLLRVGPWGGALY